jgi:uncharacterized protein YecE (DUF72 family)
MRMPSVRGYWLEHLGHPSRGGTEQAFMSVMNVRRSSGKRGRPRRTEVRFGPAGWMYKDWEGIVYPKPKPPHFDQLAYIADFFDTVEINSSFYGPPTPKTSRQWVQRVSANGDFRFTAKLWKRFTHERAKAWTRSEVTKVRRGFDVLMESGKLGAVLLQFPWSFKRTEPNQEWLGDVTRTFSLYPLVLEVRHSSWLTPDFLPTLAQEGIGFVNIDQPLFSKSIGPTAYATSRVGYIRVHGRNYKDWFRKKAPVEQRYNYLYRADQLEPWVERAKEVTADPATREVYVVTNNHYKGKAVANALMMKSMMGGDTVTAPPGVYEAYRESLEDYAEPASKAELNTR